MTHEDGRKPVLSSFVELELPFWVEFVAPLSYYEYPGLVSWLRALVRLSRGREAVILRGSVPFVHGYRDLLGALYLRRIRRFQGTLLITDATIEPTSRAMLARLPKVLRPFLGLVVAWLAKLLIRGIDGPQVRWCVLSRDELETFPQVWGVPRERMLYTAFPHTLTDALGVNRPTRDDGYLWAGGDSLRNYPLLEEAVRGTGIRTIVASRTWRPHSAVEIEAAPVPHAEFLEQMAHARAVVVPLEDTTRSAGQQTYLNAMALGKVVVVNDVAGARDYITDGVDGVIAANTPSALRDALLRVTNPEGTASFDEMRIRARNRSITKHSTAAYLSHLLEILDIPHPS